jgi:benzoyl-CoA reductase subunit C
MQWDGLERTFDRCRAALEDLDFAEVRRWKAAHPGRQAIAYFPVYAPVEIIDAAGMLPVCVAGAGDRLDIQHADSRFGSFICSIVKTTMEMGLTQKLDLFEGFLFSSICDSARNLCWVMKRNFPAMYCDFLHLPHNPASGASAEYLASEYRRLIGELEKLGGDPVTPERLRAALLRRNRQRALVRELYALRVTRPESVSTYELYLLARAGNIIPVEDHVPMLEGALHELRHRSAKKRDSIRVVVEGSFCEQPPLEVIRMIEAAGCYVVDDDFSLAQRWFTGDVNPGGDCLLNLASAYVDQAVYSSVRHDFRQPRWEGLAEKVRSTRADAVIFLIAKFCEPALFDYVPFKQTLETMGTPHLLLEFEEKLFTFERLRTEVETFVESLVFD